MRGLLIALTASLAFAQLRPSSSEYSGALFGQVIDLSGAETPNVWVKLKPVAPSQNTATVKTDQLGRFSFAGLQPQKYELKVEAPPGFQSVVRIVDVIAGKNIDLGIITLLILQSPSDDDTQPVQLDQRLASIRRIRIGSIAQIGPGESSELLRTALRTQLRQTGFTVVDAEDNADAILNVTAWSFWPNTEIVALAVLKTPDGDSLWEKEFQSRNIFGRAEAIARMLRKDVTLTAKSR